MLRWGESRPWAFYGAHCGSAQPCCSGSWDQNKGTAQRRLQIDAGGACDRFIDAGWLNMDVHKEFHSGGWRWENFDSCVCAYRI